MCPWMRMESNLPTSFRNDETLAPNSWSVGSIEKEDHLYPIIFETKIFILLTILQTCICTICSLRPALSSCWITSNERRRSSRTSRAWHTPQLQSWNAGTVSENEEMAPRWLGQGRIDAFIRTSHLELHDSMTALQRSFRTLDGSLLKLEADPILADCFLEALRLGLERDLYLDMLLRTWWLSTHLKSQSLNTTPAPCRGRSAWWSISKKRKHFASNRKWNMTKLPDFLPVKLLTIISQKMELHGPWVALRTNDYYRHWKTLRGKLTPWGKRTMQISLKKSWDASW